MSDRLERLDSVAQRFAALARSELDGLTGADERTGERWDAGQVWAHTAEFPAYWVGQVRLVVDSWDGRPVAFGRVKTDPDRVAAIERDRRTAPASLAARVADGIELVRQLVLGLPEAAWSAVGVHSTLGEMPLDRIVEEFLLGHLEEHAAQLESLATTPPTG